jgi:hypothetical protein
MDRPTLETRIESWPSQWKAARDTFTEATAALTTISLEVERLEMEAEALAQAEDAEEAALSGGMDDSPALIEAERQQLEIDLLVQQAVFDVKRIKATVEVAIRDAALEARTKPTESAVDARVKSNTEYIEAQRRLLTLKGDIATAKLNRTHVARSERDEAERERRAQLTARRQAAPLEAVESPALTKMRNKLATAEVKLDLAKTELQYQARIGRSLKMLTDLLKIGDYSR